MVVVWLSFTRVLASRNDRDEKDITFSLSECRDRIDFRARTDRRSCVYEHRGQPGGLEGRVGDGDLFRRCSVHAPAAPGPGRDLSGRDDGRGPGLGG